MGVCDGRVVIVTGAGRGLGRAYALELARQGAAVVVNDLGVSNHGEDTGETPAAEVVAEIEAMGGRAMASYCDVSDWEGTGKMVADTIEAFGGLHAVVNNAGFVRDRMFVSATPDEWDAIMKVHLRGHFCTARHATDYWRGQAKAGAAVDGRIVNTTSGAGLHGSIGQTAYSAAKAGIAGMTLVQAAELARYGITANALAPNARTRMTEGAFGEAMSKTVDGFDIFAPENTAPLVAWLCSAQSAEVTGQVFELIGGKLRVCLGWNDGPELDAGRIWQADELGDVMAKLMDQRPAAKPVWGTG